MVDPNIHGKSHGKIDSAVLAHFLCRFFSYDSQSLKRFFFAPAAEPQHLSVGRDDATKHDLLFTLGCVPEA